MTGRRTSAILERTEVVCLVVLIVATPTVFTRNTFSTFDVPQVTILWLAAMTMGLIAVARRLLFGRDASLPRPVMVAAAAFLISLGLNVALSPQPWVAFTGLPVRGAGALTYGLCLLIFLCVYRLVTHQGPTVIVRAFVTAHVVVAGYALLQAYDGDPYQWGEGELWVGTVFSTLGNPNFSAAYLAVTLPLVAWLAFGSTGGRTTHAFGGALLGATTVAISHLDSFQGDVAALVSMAVIAHWALYRVRGGRLAATAVVIPATLAVVGLPLFFQQPSKTLCIAVVACLAATACLSVGLDLRHPILGAPVAIRWTRRRILVATTTSLFVLVATIGIAGSRIIDEMRSGFRPRIEFWRTSLSIFADHPIVGTGLETYSAYYTSHRSLSNAVNSESVLTDSPHSVPVGLLSGGGLLVSASYVLLVGLIAWAAFRAIYRLSGSTRLLAVAVFAAWVAYHIQSLVSIDMPGLIAVQWILGGSILALAAPARGASGGVTPKYGSHGHRTASNHMSFWRWLSLPLVFGLWLASLGPATAPLRADMEAGQAQRALDRGDLQAGGESLLRAIDLQPRRSFYADGMALVYSESGLHELAYEEYARSGDLQPGNPFAAVNAGTAAMRIGRVKEASTWFERAVLDGPYQAQILTDAAAFYATIGDGARSTEILRSFEVLGSRSTNAWATARDAYLLLGDIESAARVYPCTFDYTYPPSPAVRHRGTLGVSVAHAPGSPTTEAMWDACLGTDLGSTDGTRRSQPSSKNGPG